MQVFPHLGSWLNAQAGHRRGGEWACVEGSILQAVGHLVLIEKRPCSVLGSKEKGLALPVPCVPAMALTLLQLCVANRARVVPVILLEEVLPLLDELPKG